MFAGDFSQAGCVGPKQLLLHMYQKKQALLKSFERACFGHAVITMLLAGEVCLYAAILGSAGLEHVAGDRPGLAVAFGGYAAGIDSEGCADVFPDAFGTAFGKFLVIIEAGDAVRMAGNLAPGPGEFLEELANILQVSFILWFDVGLVRVELDIEDGWFVAEPCRCCGSLGR